MIDILLVEDNEEIGSLVCSFLKKDGYDVEHVVSGEEAVSFIESNTARLLLLDIMLPGIDGYVVCKKVRENGNVPILIMSAKVEKDDKLKGYELGADDYIEKPFDIDLLRAKIKAILARTQSNAQNNKIIECGDIKIDVEAMQVYKNQQLVELNVKEYELLLLLVRNAGKTLNKNYLFNEIWGSDSFSENQTLTVHIKWLRDKIEDNSKNPKHILTVWGVGYKYEKV